MNTLKKKRTWKSFIKYVAEAKRVRDANLVIKGPEGIEGRVGVLNELRKLQGTSASQRAWRRQFSA